MVTFLDNVSIISGHIEKIIKNANPNSYLISPYINLLTNIKNVINDAVKDGKKVTFVYGNIQGDPNNIQVGWRLADELEWIQKLKGCKLLYRTNLHAKCYMNEKEAVVTSMNLYGYSQTNNYEIGLLVTKADDPELYNEIATYVDDTCRHSSDQTKMSITKIEADIAKVNSETGTTHIGKDREVKPRETTLQKLGKAAKSAHAAAKDYIIAVNENWTGSDSSSAEESEKSHSTSKQSSAKKVNKDGYCIRCKATIPFRKTKPYCEKCMKSWERYSNRNYQEKKGVCLCCGKPYVASMNEPLCPKCR